MDAIDNRISDSAASADLASQIAHKEQEIEQRQQEEHQQAQALDQTSQETPQTRPAASEWDPWKVMVLRRP